jgi:hypothetical protein
MAKVKWGNALDGKLNSPIVFAYAKFRWADRIEQEKNKKRRNGRGQRRWAQLTISSSGINWSLSGSAGAYT